MTILSWSPAQLGYSCEQLHVPHRADEPSWGSESQQVPSDRILLPLTILLLFSAAFLTNIPSGHPLCSAFPLPHGLLSSFLLGYLTQTELQLNTSTKWFGGGGVWSLCVPHTPTSFCFM